MTFVIICGELFPNWLHVAILPNYTNLGACTTAQFTVDIEVHTYRVIYFVKLTVMVCICTSYM